MADKKRKLDVFRYLTSRYRYYKVRYLMMGVIISMSVAIFVMSLSLFYGLSIEDPNLLPGLGHYIVRITDSEANTLVSWLILASLCMIISSMAAIYNTVRSSIQDSKKDIGVLRSIGLSDKETTKIFLYESLWLSSVSWLIGFFSGLLIVNQFFHQYYMEGKGAMFFAPSKSIPLVAIISLVFTLMITMIASYIPSVQASRLDIVSTIADK